MPLQDYMQIVSVDDRLVEHPRVWQDRLPAKFKEAGPRIVEHEGTNSRKRAAEVLADVPDDECDLIVEQNARRMLSFPRAS